MDFTSIYKKAQNLINSQPEYDNEMSVFANVMVYLAKNCLDKNFIFDENIQELITNFSEDENIINYIFENETDISTISKQELSKVFDDFLLYIESKNENQILSLSQFWKAHDFLTSEISNVKNIYFPNFVFGKALFIFRESNFNKDKNLYFSLFNTSKYISLLTKMYFWINEIQNVYFVENVYKDTMLYDNIITFTYYTKWEENIFKNQNDEVEVVKFLLTKLTPQGNLILGVLDSFLSNKAKKYIDFRKTLIESDLIQMVSELPKSMSFSIGNNFFSFVIIKQCKKDSEKNHVLFQKTADVKQHHSLESILKATFLDLIPNEEIQKENYILNVGRYLHPKKVFLKEELAKNKEYAIKLNELFKQSILGIPISKDYIKELFFVDNNTNYIPYIGIGDLNKDNKNYFLNITQIKRQVSIENITKSKIIDYAVILVALLGGKLRPTYFKYEGKPIIVSSDIIVLKISEKMPINIDYLIEQLQSELTQIQVEMSLVGDTLKRLKIDDFLDISIILPSIEKQKEILVNIQKEKIQQFFEENKIKEQEIKNAEYDVLAITIHDLNQKLGAMQNGLNMIQRFFSEKSQKNEPILVDDFVVPIYETDTLEMKESFKLKAILQNIINTRNEASAQLNATREEVQNNKIKPEKVKIKHFFDTEIKPLYQNNITFLTEGENIEIELDKNRIKNMVRNLIDNAKTHGKATEIAFSFDYANDEDNLSIIYKNNGKPFPADFDFEKNFKRLYHKTTNSKGSGIGGYSINKTVELHSAKMKNISPKDIEGETYPFQIEFIFPILYTKNTNYVKSNSYFID